MGPPPTGRCTRRRPHCGFSRCYVSPAAAAGELVVRPPESGMENPKPEGALIPTVRRAKLRRGQCYTIGAEALTAGLASVPQLAQLSVEFESRSWWEGKIAVAYTSRPGCWQITVGSVPAEHRAAIRDALL